MTAAEWVACRDPGRMLAFLLTPDTNWFPDRKPRRYVEGAGFQELPSDRRLRLALAACCRRAWGSLGVFGRAAVEDAERVADGELPGSVLEDRRRAADQESAQSQRFAPGNRANFASAWLCGDLANPDQVLRACAVTAGFAAADYEGMLGEADPDGLTAFGVAQGGPRAGVAHPGPINARWQAAYDAERAAQADVLRHVFAPWGLPALPAAALAGPDVGRLAEALYDCDNDGSAACFLILADALDEAGSPPQWGEHFRGRADHPKGCAWVDWLLHKS